MVTMRFIARVIDLMTMLVLARLLSPSDFGLVAIAMTMVSFLEAALELPLSQALVSLPELKPVYYNTAFTLGALRGLVLCVMVCGCAAPFAAFYHESRLVPLICALGLAPVARGLVNPRLAQYAKDLNFKWEFLFELSGKTAAFAAAVTVAVLTKSYWSIAVCTIAGPLISGMMSYTLLPFRPKLTLSEWRIFKEFLGWMSLSQIVMAINWQSEQFILGRLMPPARFGQFSTANNLTNIPMTIMFVPVLRPLLSAFALVKHDTPRLARSYRNAASAVVVVGLPILIGEAILAAPEVRLLLGQKWLGAIPMLHWLAISLMPGLFAIPFTPLGMALNQTRQLTFRNLVQLCVKLPLVIGGALTYGFAGVIGARIISEVFTTFYCMHVAKKILGIPIIGQFVDCWRAFVAALAMFDAIKLSEPYFAGGPGLFNLSLQLLALVAIGAVTYIGSLLIFWLASGKPEGIESTATRLLLGILGRKSAARIPVEAAGTEPN